MYKFTTMGWITMRGVESGFEGMFPLCTVLFK